MHFDPRELSPNRESRALTEFLPLSRSHTATARTTTHKEKWWTSSMSPCEL